MKVKDLSANQLLSDYTSIFRQIYIKIPEGYHQVDFDANVVSLFLELEEELVNRNLLTKGE